MPIMVMPEWMLELSDWSPVKWMILAIEGATWRGFAIGDLLLPCGILLGFGAAGFLAGAAVLSRRA